MPPVTAFDLILTAGIVGGFVVAYLAGRGMSGWRLERELHLAEAAADDARQAANSFASNAKYWKRQHDIVRDRLRANRVAMTACLDGLDAAD